MSSNVTPLDVRLVLIRSDGSEIVLTLDEVERVLDFSREIRREAFRWSRMVGPGGRLVVIDEELVAAALAELDRS
ncbi:MAG: hypothetical protein ACRD3V_23895 [Vicinamibacteria bacterium]